MLDAMVCLRWSIAPQVRGAWRIIARETTPVDLPQLLVFVRGCGYDGQEETWTDVWNKISASPPPDGMVNSGEEIEIRRRGEGDHASMAMGYLPITRLAGDRTTVTGSGLVLTRTTDGRVTVTSAMRPSGRTTVMPDCDPTQDGLILTATRDGGVTVAPTSVPFQARAARFKTHLGEIARALALSDFDVLLALASAGAVTPGVVSGAASSRSRANKTGG